MTKPTTEIQKCDQISTGGWSCPRICPGMCRKTDRLQSIAIFPPLRAYTMFVPIGSAGPVAFSSQISRCGNASPTTRAYRGYSGPSPNEPSPQAGFSSVKPRSRPGMKNAPQRRRHPYLASHECDFSVAAGFPRCRPIPCRQEGDDGRLENAGGSILEPAGICVPVALLRVAAAGL